MLEFDNLIIFNVYLQAGTRNSPGQKDLWFNYSRCRYNEYLAIGRYLKDNKINKPIVVLGDFNTNLNGTIDEWPELKAFKQLNLQDSWLEKYDNNGGFTEDTSINLMRWNVKFEEKIYRIDGIFYTKDKLKTSNIKILGNIPIDIDKDMQQKFKDIRIPEIPKKDELIRKNGDQIQLWPSDHFAVLAELELILFY
jgi:endonuclease/exonuclease/phosphatase family metal-dependent hydrolase